MDINISNAVVDYESGGETRRVLNGLNLTVKSGEFVSILGPSGCGKTTLLKYIGGFLEGGRPSRQVFMIFQDFHQLFPWRTLGDNISYAIRKSSGKNRPEARKKAEQVLKEVGLEDFYDYYPHQLSGGMKQRGALARALAVESRVLLMDEPFSSLDPESREAARRLLLKIWKERGLTVIFVTHDPQEAAFLSDKILYFKDLNGEVPV